MSAGHLERRRSMSSGSRSVSAALMPSPPLDINNDLEPCAATASSFLFAQGSTILSLHHDTLALDRKFEAHSDNILFIAVDNVSETGAGRLVVSYDASQTAIIWDLFTGQEIARFASFEMLRVAAWMRNGNIALGGEKGTIILFEPSTSEHISARTIFDPVTALAPAADCRSHAIGYRNGSILIATLQPFTILHTLTTSRGPSPIVSLAWHASSTKQKSDMLATLTVDGDLLVWSVSKHPTQDSARVIRTLRKSESVATSPKWLAWSKNGRIVQYSDSETWAWDVRTKHVTYERIPTVQGVRGIANYGPTATLFTLGPNHTVQQYELINPTMVADVQHLPSAQASTPAEGLNASMPLQAALASSTANQAHRTIEELKQGSPPIFPVPSFEMSEAARVGRGSLQSPDSLRSRHHHSRPSRSLYSGTGTTFSTSSPVQSTAESMYSLRYGSSASVTSGGSLRTASRLRHEYVPSKSEEPLVELFPYTRSRLNDVPFKPPQRLNETDLDPDALRKQMLNVVFGWEGDIIDLLTDEIRRHSPGSEHAVILARWLGCIDQNVLLGMASSVTSRYTGWMLLALSTLNGQAETKTMGHAFVQKLLARGDIHAAVALLIGMGDGNDGIEIYVSRNMYMEAILLTCLVMPMDWSRQSYLVRRWGEFVVQNSQQHLAIRCFSCADLNNSDAWASPSVQMTNILSNQLANKSAASSPSVIVQPPQASSLSPSSARPTAKNQALKLITSFGPEAPAFKFPGLQSADRTPTNMPGVTPIDSAMGDSVMSPGGFSSYKQKTARQTLSARAITPGGHSHRLPSIGETPTDVNPPNLAIPKSLPTPDNSGSEKEKEKGKETEETKAGTTQYQPVQQEQLVYLTSARYTPQNEPAESEQASNVPHGDGSTTALPISRPDNLSADFSVSTRNGSRDRKPEGLHIKWPPAYSPHDVTPSSGGSLPSLTSLQRRDAGGVSGASPTWTSDSAKSLNAGSSSTRNVNNFINTLDSSSYYSHTQGLAADYGHKGHKKSKESRGRSKQRYIQPAKRSPSSPVPMSPEDLALYASTGNSTSSKTKESKRHRSRSENSRPRSSRARGQQSRDALDRSQTRTTQGRSRPREGSFGIRSPSSPVPMSPSEKDSTAEAHLRLVTADRQQRLQSRERASSRQPERDQSARRGGSPDRGRVGSRSRSRPAREPAANPLPTLSNQRFNMPGHTEDGTPIFAETIEWAGPSNDAQKMKEAERIRKEQAAAELEARRLSLVRRPSAPAVPLPGELGTPNSVVSARSRRQSGGSPPLTNGSFSQRAGVRQGGSPATSTYSDTSTGRGAAPVPVGLPATPRAMKHPKYSVGYNDIPPMPDLNFDSISPIGNGEHGRSLSISRSMSAPIPEDVGDQPAEGIPAHPHFRPRLPSSRGARISMHRKEASHDAATLNGSQYGSVSGQASRKPSEAPIPPVLPELQHLSDPPPPPPPPAPSNNGIETSSEGLMHAEERSSLISGVGTINIAIGEPTVLNTSEQRSQSTLPSPEFMPPLPHRSASAQGPMPETHTHRRGRSINDNLANKFRSLTGRMRSTSRGRNVRTPPSGDPDASMPYESVPMASVIEGGLDRMNKNEF
ncbi:predicted protein [Uncinocarpus reesii 1704]|uniref:Gem-associated protein 5 TPR domain-containing protein n=1 Tax=Uncinocarpus reesii (strain UAMH 1704) TaxID=336963 RepID=C4JQE2_UNCRE|nr:uncharacterized protein UREG_04696 [Uncinocarpus reesii 1704]EEP79850.1 predicted protein [Uncinocarpus reesii 1704]